MYDPLLREALNSGEEDARFLAPLLTVTEAGRNLLISPSTVKDWKTHELVHSVAPLRRGAPTLPLAGVAEAQVLRGLRLRSGSGYETGSYSCPRCSMTT